MRSIETKTIKGFAMFLNLYKFKEIGFFDENFFIYLEEIDLCKRVIKNGNKIYFSPDIYICHEGGASHDNEINHEMELSRNWHWMWSTFYYNKKYKGFLISLILVLPKLISSILKMFIFAITKENKFIIKDILDLLIQYLEKVLGIDPKFDYLLICPIFKYKDYYFNEKK